MTLRTGDAGETKSDGLAAETLTRREREVLALLAQGLSGPEIAQQLTLGLSSVKSHMQHVYGKLGANSKRQAVARARELGLLGPGAQTAAPEAAPPAAAPGPKHNLPLQLTRFFGRERDRSEIRRLLSGQAAEAARLVTLIGPGGSGKTRLALAISSEAVEAFAGGVWLVELGLLAEAGLLDQTIAMALGLREQVGRPLRATVTTFLQNKALLLVLDNCEHLIDACAQMAGALLLACPQLTILATSREALNIPGETVWPVLGLDMPLATPDQKTAGDDAAGYAAVQLFTERAQAVRPTFSLTPKNVASVVQLCRRLDGLPLAIELAAARVALLPVEQIAALLDDRFQLLTSGSRMALPRHQTLLAAIEWSYHLLSEPERLLLRRLCVFAGGWTLAAAQAVCVGGAGEPDPTDSALPAGSLFQRLAQLTAKSLVVSDPTPNGEARFRLLETIRDYARHRLYESGEAAALSQRHFDSFLSLAEQAQKELQGPDQVAWLDRLEAELDNLRAALDWAAQQSATTAGLRLASALYRLWDVRGYWSEGYQRLSQALSTAGATQPLVDRALALAWTAHLAQQLGHDEAGAELARASLALARQLGPAGTGSAAYALLELGSIAFWHYQPEADDLFRESLAAFEAAGDQTGQAWALQSAGWRAIYNGAFSSASQLAQASRALFEKSGDLVGIAKALAQLGTVARRQGEYGRARDLAETALAVFRQLRDRGNCAFILRDLGDAYNHLGQNDRAIAAAAESVALMRGVGGAHHVPRFLNDQSQIAIRYGDYEQATRLLEESRQLATELGLPGEVVSDDVGLGYIARARGDPVRALSLVEPALAYFRALGEMEGIIYNQPDCAMVLRDLGRYEQARGIVLDSLDWFRRHGNLPETAWNLLLLGGIVRRQGDLRLAASVLVECLQMCQQMDLRPLRASCLAELACLAADMAHAVGNLPEAQEAGRLLGAAESLCRATGLSMPPADQADLAAYNGAVLILQALLGEDRLSAARAEGQGLSADQAAALALAAVQPEFPLSEHP